MQPALLLGCLSELPFPCPSPPPRCTLHLTLSLCSSIIQAPFSLVSSLELCLHLLSTLSWAVVLSSACLLCSWLLLSLSSLSSFLSFLFCFISTRLPFHLSLRGCVLLVFFSISVSLQSPSVCLPVSSVSPSLCASLCPCLDSLTPVCECHPFILQPLEDPASLHFHLILVSLSPGSLPFSLCFSFSPLLSQLSELLLILAFSRSVDRV